MRVASLVLVVVASAGAFAPPTPTFQAKPTVGVSSSTVRFLIDGTQDDQQVRRYEFPSDNGNISNQKRSSKLVPAAGSVMMAWLTTTGVANADSPDWGIFEGRTGSLLHPLTMGSLFVFSLYTAFLGFQWRRQRTIGDEIGELKKSMPSLGSYKTINEALASGEIDNAAALQAAIPIEQQIQALTAERKELSSQNNRDRHYGQGSWIALIGTLFAIEGPLNTYARAGKLFPGPHLYSGAGLVCCWAAAVACVPYMTKGNDTARTLHIGFNVAGLALFAWQVQSGIPILLKVVELTKWP